MASLLILTNSYDVTTDLLIQRMVGQSVFRLNFDQIALYRIRIGLEDFTISDQTGRTISSNTVKKAYWRKPFSAEVGLQGTCNKFVEAELKYVLSELVNLLWSEKKLVLVEPYAEKRTGKLVQLRQASPFFAIPAFEFVLNQTSTISPAVVKSLSNEPVDGKVLYTTVTQAQHLNQHYPWFVERLVPGIQDVTIVFVRGQIFSLERDFLDRAIDWRQFISPEQRWRPHAIPTELRKSIQNYMDRLRLDYGRLDFLLDAQGFYWFCEVNTNGQFAWLDLNDEHGLLRAVIQEISPETEVVPIRHHPLTKVSNTENSTVRETARREFCAISE